LKELPDTETTKQQWKAYAAAHPSEDYEEDGWEDAYLPADEEELAEMMIPRLPLLLDFDHITRRIAAQRSRFMLFGTDPNWLAQESASPNSTMRSVIIDANSCREIRLELRDSGVTESVIFPDLDGLGREMKQLWDERK
jgi:hypothetical protein